MTAPISETTPSGTPYTIYYDPTGRHRYGIADGHTGPTNLFIYVHGSGGGVESFGQSWTPTRYWLMDNGWAWVESEGGGRHSWGNQEARDDYREAVSWVDSQIDVEKIIVLGRSMGGIVSYWLYLYDPVISPRAEGLILNSATTDLEYKLTDGFPEGNSLIFSAHGVETLAEFQEKILPQVDPMRFPVEDWGGKRVLQTYGTADVDVPPEHHAIPWLGKYGQACEIAIDSPLEDGTHTGGHTSVTKQQQEGVNFMLRVTTGPAPPPAPPHELPHIGYTRVGRFFFTNGAAAPIPIPNPMQPRRG